MLIPIGQAPEWFQTVDTDFGLLIAEKHEMEAILKKIADLIYFEGPLLSLFRDINGEKYLYYWCDVSDVCNRWLVLRISDKRLDLYLRQKISLRDVIIKPDDGLLHAIDIDQELCLRNLVVLSPEELPESYIPDEDSYYEFTPEFMEGESYSFAHLAPD